MSLLSGFDFVYEISNETFLKQIKANLKIQDVPVSPPFQIKVPIASGRISGSVWLKVEDLTIDFNSVITDTDLIDNSLSLNLQFDKTSILIESPLSKSICPLDGIITIKTPLLLVIGEGTNTQKVVADLPNANVNIDFSAASNMIIVSALAGLPFTLDQFKDFANQAFTDFIHGMEQNELSPEFTVVPDEDGSLSPLQFERLELKCVGNSDRRQQALCLLGILLNANNSNGTTKEKTTSAISLGNDQCISISPGAFHSLIFCESLATVLNTTVPTLPTSCGSSSGFDTTGVTVTSLTDGFDLGHIDINGSVKRSGTCYDATGTFHGTITMSITGSTLKPTVKMDDLSVDVDIPWYCWVVGGLVYGPLLLVITAIVNSVWEENAKNIELMAILILNNFFGNSLSSVNVGNLGGATFKEVSITQEGMTLQGSAPYIALPNPMTPKLSIIGSVFNSTETPIGSGTYHATFLMCGIEKDYPYTEYAQQQTGVYTAHASDLTPPLKFQWEIRVPKAGGGGADVYPLTGNSGTVSFPAKTDYPLPLPGGSSVDHVIHIGYTKLDSTIWLTNQPSEGNYSFPLYVRCNDCAGTSLEAEEWFIFQGDNVEIGGGFYEDQQACNSRFMEWLNEHIKLYPKKKIPLDLIGPIGYPATHVIVESIYELVSSNVHEADVFLLNMKLAHGSSYYRGLYSKDATKVGLSQEAKANVSEKARFGISQEYIQDLLTSLSAVKTKEIRR